jgi:hypothetical protein
MTKDDIKNSATGVRFNSGKLRWSLVHFGSLEPMVRALEFGARKYDDHNWKKGLPPKEILESMQRHLAALIDGERLDPETGLPHIGHVQCNAMFYSYFTENGRIDSTTKTQSDS